jgi:hypothetical protein
MSKSNSALIYMAIALASAPAFAEVDFNKEIRPLLNKECIVCHGGVKKAGGISLQFRDLALKKGESEAIPIVPGKPEESEAFLRLISEDKTERMPKKAPPLKPEEIAKFKQWIAEGAPWADHWSLTPIVKPPVPAIADARPIDAFIQARLAAEKLSPAPEASRPALLRRLSLDLIGLPPTLEEVAAFENDTAPGACDRQVDRLLASPHFGERWAALWMDLARYSDTKGYEADRPRPMWPYRDWLVCAFNADLPFDQFTIKQIAGDLLPNASEEDRVASAMHRLTSTNDEGGTDDEEFRTSAVLDRVNTTWEAWMGTSFGCAQCHDHPYDPFSNKEFYELVAFFNNTADADRGDEAPTMDVFLSNEDKSKHAALDAEIARLKTERDALQKQLKPAIEDWRPLAPSNANAGEGLTVSLKEGEIHLEGTAPPTDTTTVVSPLAAGMLGAIRIDTLPQPTRAGKGAGLGGDGNFVLTGFEAALILPDGKEQPIEFVKAEADFEQKSYPIINALKNPDPDGTGWAVSPQIDKPHFAIFRAKESLTVPADANLRIKLLHQHTAKGQYQGASLAHFKLSTTAVAMPPVDPIAAEISQLDESIKAKARDRDAIAITRLPVMVELSGDKARKSHAFIRGNWLNKGDEVQPATPASLPPMPKDAPRNRLTFAQWLVSKDHPLTARVTVNHVWEQLFGIGLVETAEDFGTKGETPTHPELLDWLAATFRDDLHWSFKQLVREVVLSHAYRQDNRAAAALIERDPRNRLLARGPRVRLSAEMVRDNALAVSGLLSGQLGGPSVMPPLPPGVLVPSPYTSENWTDAKGPDRYRRSIYTYWKRSNPYPSLVTFDSAERTVCTSRRLRTNTPLQALVTLNDPVYVEAAQALAKRMRAEAGPDLDTQVARGWQLATLTTPQPDRVEKLTVLYRESLAQFQAQPDDAKRLAATPEDAALTNVASVILNLDQVLTK